MPQRSSPPPQGSRRKAGLCVRARLARRGALWLLSIRDAFVSLIPLTLFGVLAVLLRNLPLPFHQHYLQTADGAALGGLLDRIIEGTHGVSGLALAVLVAIHLRQRQPAGPTMDDMPPMLAVGLSSLINFMLATLTIFHQRGALGFDLMLIGIGIGLFSAEYLRWASRRRWLTLFDTAHDTDTEMHAALRLCLPTIVSGLIALTAASLLAVLPGPDRLFVALAGLAQESTHGNYLAVTFATLTNQLFWFVGVHGGHILDTFGGSLFAAAPALPGGHLLNRTLFNAFVLVGGAGATLGLLAALHLNSRCGGQRRIARIAAIPALFNINEMVLFGLPVVLSPFYLIPFVLAPVSLGLLSVAALNLGWLELRPVNIPWTTPPILSGWLLTGSLAGVLLQSGGILLSTAIYWPFVKAAERQRVAGEDRLFKETAETILGNRPGRASVLRRTDETGLLGRRVLARLREDIRHGRLLLHFQPKHDGEDRLLGFEALVRWPQAPHRAITPAVTVALAEDGGAIGDLGGWVFAQALAFKEALNREGFGVLTVAVNVSPVQLADAGFAERIAAILGEHRVRPEEIEIEITESHAMPDDPTSERNIRRLAEMGFALAMDDFGMGHTSLLHLRRFDVAVIKIDGSLTREVRENGTNADIIRAITALGRARGIAVVAEFVESGAQKQALQAMGCTVFQGYHYSPPLPAAACLDYCRRHPPAATPPGRA